MNDSIPFGSPDYLALFALLLFARGMDFLSTWIATPHMVLEGNPIAKWLGWKWGAVVNLFLCLSCAFDPLAAIIVTTISLLVAARNFQGAWLMRSLGEGAYRTWISRRFEESGPGLFIACLAAQCLLTASLGAALLLWSGPALVPTGIGIGMIGYALAVLVYSLIALRRRPGNPEAE